jgi:hypothetical protein
LLRVTRAGGVVIVQSIPYALCDNIHDLGGVNVGWWSEMEWGAEVAGHERNYEGGEIPVDRYNILLRKALPRVARRRSRI